MIYNYSVFYRDIKDAAVRYCQGEINASIAVGLIFDPQGTFTHETSSQIDEPNVECALTRIFFLCNDKAGLRRSLSMGDIVVIAEQCYFCGPVDWHRLETAPKGLVFSRKV